MNSKIYVGAIVAGFAVILGIIAIFGSSIIDDTSENGFFLNPQEPVKVLPVEIELEDLSVLEVTDTTAIIQIKFKISNPNYKSVILQIISYELFEDGIRITGGQIGTRAEGMVAASNYYMILNEYPTVLTDQIIITNTGDNPEFWSALRNGNASWRITGDAFFNLSSLTSGEENASSFEFLK